MVCVFIIYMCAASLARLIDLHLMIIEIFLYEYR